MQLRKVTILIAFISGGLLGWLANTTTTSPERITLRSQTAPQSTTAEAALSVSERSLHRTRTLLQQALTAHTGHPPNRAGEAYVNELIETLAQIAPIETARLIIEAPIKDSARVNMLRLTARIWYENAGVEALSLLTRADTSRDLEPFMHPLFSWIANQEPLRALPHILALPSSKLREALFFNIAHGVDVKDVDAIIQIIDDLPADERARVARLAGDALARKAPELALLWADTLPNVQASGIREAALRTIASTDPLRAINLVKSTSVENGYDVVRNALAVLARTDPLEAIGEYERLTDPARKGQGLSGLISGWSTHDPAAAANWLLLLDTPGKEGLLRMIGRSWAQSEPGAAADYVSQLPAQNRLAWLRGIVRTTADNAPQDNLEWIQRFRDEEFFPGLLANSLQYLYRQDDSEALDYVMAMDDVSRNIALPGLISRTARKDAARAAAWVAEITDVRSRRAATETVVEKWTKQDFRAAEQWINELPEGDIKDTAFAAMIIHGGTEENASLAANIKNRETRLYAYLGSAMPHYCAKISVSFLQQIPLNAEQWRSVETRLRSSDSTAEGSFQFSFR